MKHIFISVINILLFLFCIVPNAFSQSAEKIQISGTVIDESKEPMVGVAIYVKNETGLGTTTDINGKYKITATKNSTLIFSFIGYDKQEIIVDGKTTLDIQMTNTKSSVLDEVVITGFGAQKKVSISGAITTVDMKTLKVPTANITNALQGNIAGIIAMQTSGEPGANSSEFWIRGISTFGAGSNALVLVDGFERPFNEINIEDIESFSVLKDASATSIYGSRGANGVLLITTKKGEAGKIKISGKAEYGYNTRTRTPEFVDGNTYASLLNEALRTRNLEPIYNDIELDIIKYNLDPDLYPNINWKDVLLKDGANAYRASINLNGGGQTARYFVSGSYVNEGGMYKTDDALNKYNTNSNLERYNYRSNVDIDITKTTVLHTGVAGFLEKQNRSGLDMNIWEALVGYAPVATPITYSNGLVPAYGTGNLTNPWVMATQTGYREFWRSKVETNVSLDQNLDFVTQGLRFTGRFAFDSDSKNNIRHIKWPEQYNTQRRRDSNGNIVFYRVSTERLMEQESDSWGERIYNLEGELAYNRRFMEAHNVAVFVKYSQREQGETSNVGTDIERGIPRRDQSLAGRVTYDFKNRYFIEFNGGYTGSEVFKFGHQFGFFPAISGAWNISEEPFIKKITSIFDLLKIRYSYGQVGNNKITDDVRFPYLGSIDEMAGYNYGDIGSPYSFSGLHIGVLAADYLSWEVATKHNLGFDFNLFNNMFSGAIDIYKDTRDKIYMQRSHLSEMTGITSTPWANVGKMENRGFDGQFNFNKKFGEVELTMRSNITYSRNKVLAYDEEANALPYQMTEGYRWQQAKGLIDLGLFKDYDDIRNSPKQVWGTTDAEKSRNAPMPGDIKYKDINGDGIINDLDEVAIGATRVPNLIYGIGVSSTWKGWDLNIHFQGAGKSSYFINGPAVYPFYQTLQGNILPWGNILSDLAVPGNRWISRDISGDPSTENVNAKYPRLSYGGNANNYRASTYWLRNGAYLRFKTFEIGYTIPKQYTNKLRMDRVRVHFIGTNLFVWDTLKLWDPELASGDGMKYPIAKNFTVGVTIGM
ncbi:TonB-linked outer membrane protein, SusC/RagA family [uncultured Paludibacter sp.]|uniref:TonB-linked outer membrane protein, SusC/RagA family n=1 Tax=uncultured Paludibacter sp. TaxID=497635 RepID=A0A653AKP2_9BACT|nr:TonB-linked outer membrane protein, SusC/RagA family [uncultured Paludibacter sp.]